MAINLLEVVNRSLMKMTEQRVSSVNQNPLAIRVSQAARDAFVSMCQDNQNWPWLASGFTLSEWAAERATIPSNVLSVSFVLSNGNLLRYLSERNFYTRFVSPITPYSSELGACWYTISGDKLVFSPYPSTPAGQAAIKCFGAVIPPIPFADEDVFAIPTRDELLLILRTCSMVSTDEAVGSTYLSEYLRMLSQAKTRVAFDTNDTSRSAIW